jgi:hypothetical protein
VPRSDLCCPGGWLERLFERLGQQAIGREAAEEFDATPGVKGRVGDLPSCQRSPEQEWVVEGRFKSTGTHIRTHRDAHRRKHTDRQSHMSTKTHKHIYTHRHTYTHAHTQSHTHTHTHTLTHTHTHSHPHTHTHTHTHTLTRTTQTAARPCRALCQALSRTDPTGPDAVRSLCTARAQLCCSQPALPCSAADPSPCVLQTRPP